MIEENVEGKKMIESPAEAGENANKDVSGEKLKKQLPAHRGEKSNLEGLLQAKDLEILELRGQIEKMDLVQQGLLRQQAVLFGLISGLEEKLEKACQDSEEAKKFSDKAVSGLSKLRKTVKDNEKSARSSRQGMEGEMQRIAKTASKVSASKGKERRKPSKSPRDPARKSSTVAITESKSKSSPAKSSKEVTIENEKKSAKKSPLEKKKKKLERQRSRGRKSLGTGSSDEKQAPIDNSRKKTVNFGTRKIMIVRPSELPEDVNTYPKSELKLQYAHGYNGHDVKVRNNLYMRGGELIFNVAATVVCHNIDSNVQRFFTEHTEDVTSIALHPTKNLMATGQQDEKGVAEPKVCIWNLETLECIKEFEGFHHGFIYHLEWSEISGMLYSCAGDDEHSLIVFDGEDIEKQSKPIFQHSPIAKTDIYGLTIQTCEVEDGFQDEFMTYGKKHLKSWKVKREVDEKRGRLAKPKFTVKGYLVPTSKPSDSKREKNYQSAITLPFWPRVYVVGGQSGKIYLVHNHKVKKTYEGFSVPVACLTSMEDGFIATSYEGEWVVWKQNEEKSELVPGVRGNFKGVAGVKGYGAPRSLYYNAETQSLYVGSRKNQIFSVCIADPENVTGALHVHGTGGEVWGLATHPTEHYFVTGGYDGIVSAYDTSTNLPLHEKRMVLPEQGAKSKEKVCCIAWSPDGKYIAVGTEMSKVFIISWDPWEKVQEIIIPLRNKSSEIEQVGTLLFNPQSTVLTVGHFDSNIYLYGLDAESDKGPWVQWSSTGLTSACTHLQFSEDGRYLKSFGRDYYLQTWQVSEKKKKLKSQPYELDPDHVKMTGNPIIAGWDVEGVLQPGMDGTDINTTSLSYGDEHEKLLVCGDDFGKVWLHKYPALESKYSREYAGHSAFVVDVKWTADNQKVVSVGGGDRAVLVWERFSAEESI